MTYITCSVLLRVFNGAFSCAPPYSTARIERIHRLLTNINSINRLLTNTLEAVADESVIAPAVVAATDVGARGVFGVTFVQRTVLAFVRVWNNVTIFKSIIIALQYVSL